MKAIKGNVIDCAIANDGAIVHAVNCLPVARAGLALEIATRFPSWRSAYLALYPELGTCFVYGPDEQPNIYIVSLYTQLSVGTTKRQTNYEALAVSLERLSANMELADRKLYIPYNMCSRLGGAAWTIVSAMLTHYLYSRDVTICMKGVT